MNPLGELPVGRRYELPAHFRELRDGGTQDRLREFQNWPSKSAPLVPASVVVTVTAFKAAPHARRFLL